MSYRRIAVLVPEALSRPFVGRLLLAATSIRLGPARAERIRARPAPLSGKGLPQQVRRKIIIRPIVQYWLPFPPFLFLLITPPPVSSLSPRSFIHSLSFSISITHTHGFVINAARAPRAVLSRALEARDPAAPCFRHCLVYRAECRPQCAQPALVQRPNEAADGVPLLPVLWQHYKIWDGAVCVFSGLPGKGMCV